MFRFVVVIVPLGMANTGLNFNFDRGQLYIRTAVYTRESVSAITVEFGQNDIRNGIISPSAYWSYRSSFNRSEWNTEVPVAPRSRPSPDTFVGGPATGHLRYAFVTFEAVDEATFHQDSVLGLTFAVVAGYGHSDKKEDAGKESELGFQTEHCSMGFDQ
jgi:hypothetical protein